MGLGWDFMDILYIKKTKLKNIFILVEEFILQNRNAEVFPFYAWAAVWRSARLIWFPITSAICVQMEINSFSREIDPAIETGFDGKPRRRDFQHFSFYTIQ